MDGQLFARAVPSKFALGQDQQLGPKNLAQPTSVCEMAVPFCDICEEK